MNGIGKFIMHNSSSYIFIHMHMYVHNIHNVQVCSHAQHTRGRTDPVREIHIFVTVTLDGKMLTPKVRRDCTGSGKTVTLTSGRWALTFCTDTV